MGRIWNLESGILQSGRVERLMSNVGPQGKLKLSLSRLWLAKYKAMAKRTAKVYRQYSERALQTINEVITSNIQGAFSLAEWQLNVAEES